MEVIKTLRLLKVQGQISQVGQMIRKDFYFHLTKEMLDIPIYMKWIWRHLRLNFYIKMKMAILLVGSPKTKNIYPL